jgi:5'-AMP-activated protein kinase beta subunit, interaction domain
MVLSKYLPTAVDFTNSLVNYIEVVPKGSPAASAQLLGSPLEAAATEPLNIKPPPGVHPPLTLPPTPELIPITDSSSIPPVSSAGKSPALKRTPKAPTPLSSGPARRYHNIIPQFFYDFLGKSVLNGVTPIKDDASVLVLPNHTVLNHLATSSIRNGVLATSATTRYKRKVCRDKFYP